MIFERHTESGIVLLTNVSAFLASKGDYIVKMARALYDPVVASREISCRKQRDTGTLDCLRLRVPAEGSRIRKNWSMTEGKRRRSESGEVGREEQRVEGVARVS